MSTLTISTRTTVRSLCSRKRPRVARRPWLGLTDSGGRTHHLSGASASQLLASSGSSKGDLTDKLQRTSLGGSGTALDGRNTLLNRRITPMDLSSGVPVPNYHRASLDLPVRQAPGFEAPSRASMSAAPGTSYAPGAVNAPVARLSRYGPRPCRALSLSLSMTRAKILPFDYNPTCSDPTRERSASMDRSVPHTQTKPALYL